MKIVSKHVKMSSRENYLFIYFTIILLISLSCGQNQSSNPDYLINGSIEYSHQFEFSSLNDPRYPGSYCGTIFIRGSIPFRIITAPIGSDSISGSGETEFTLNGLYYDGAAECLTSGHANNQVELSGVLNRINNDSQSISIIFTETWYNPGRYYWQCGEQGNSSGDYQVEHNVFSATFAVRDSSVVEYDSTITVPVSQLVGAGSYNWTMRISGRQ